MSKKKPSKEKPKPQENPPAPSAPEQTAETVNTQERSVHVVFAAYPYRYRAGDKVVICGLNKIGEVQGVYVSRGAPIFKIESVKDGEIVENWLFEDQLLPIGAR